MPELTARSGGDGLPPATTRGLAGTGFLYRFNRIGKLLQSGRAIALLTTLVVAVILATAGLTLWQGRNAAVAEHHRGMTNMGTVLAEHTSRYVQVVDLMLRAVQTRIADLHIENTTDFQQLLGNRKTHLYLAKCLKNVPQAEAIVIIDANGQVLNWSRDRPVVRLDAADRDYYSYLRDHSDPGLFIGSLLKGRADGRLSLSFARRISGPNDEFLGLVLGIVDVEHLIAFYRTAGEQLKQAVTLLRRDGTMLVRYPNPEAAIDMRMPLGSAWYDHVANGGSYLGFGGGDGDANLVSVHPLHEYPLVVDVLMKETDLFAHWHRDVLRIAIYGLSAALAFAGLFWMLARQFRRQSEQNARLEEAAISLHEGHELLRAYAEMSVDWFWEQDTEFRFKQKTLIPFMKASDDTGKTRWELAGAAMTAERWAAHKADLAARRPFRNFCWERVDEDGSRHFMNISGNPVFDRAGVFSGYRGTGREITAEVEAKARLAKANAALELGHQQMDAVLNNITQGVSFFDGEKRLLLCNRRYGEIYNLPPEATQVGRSTDEITTFRIAAGSGPDPSRPDYEMWLDRIEAARMPANATWQLANGRFVAVSYQPIAGGGWVATHEDVTERQQAEASIVFMAHHDALTRLPNRVLFRERMEQAIATACRGSSFAVFCLDLDKFKQVNDTLGHPAGDELLVAAADRLRACVRNVDTLARLGGDEFAIIQSGISHRDDAEKLVSRILAAFHQPFEVCAHQVVVGVSIGVTVAPDDSALYETLMRNADTALYLAKTEGRGTARFFEPEMDARIHRRRVLERDLQGAIARGEFELYYQPQINLTTNRISGFEALLRWHHPVRGLVSPLEFIPVAEETGLIGPIGDWVLRTACFEAENWPSEVSVAVNLSPVQFTKGDLVATVQAALAASGLRSDRLELEITESVFLRDTTETLTALHQLRAMGISVALDDFGTGYSSLSYLRSFPFNKIKIDQSFVRDLMANRESMSIVRAVTGLGQSLGMMTIAEGVETREQLGKLREEGCTEVQGDLFSAPRRASEVLLLIESFHQTRGGVISVPA